MHNISPFLRSPMTDITGGIISYQLLGQCAKQEMELMDCMEAYGLDRGLKKCKKLVEDYRECHTKLKQFRRFYEIRRERDRQIAEKKLTGKKIYCNPKIDSF
ncbi:NADH dehydrogenase [ubiquinone] iron-sulfur protein 5-like [Trichoplusia ni]|uniref:NADH dehydrogenase [ubiquinone] iron-sulfur protein 5-like n=1 Tax=Trichoplusia ni TaxID=7111 RepID=A0A7E5WTD5_TRINI|nr:NADH dehydrogenase [ubiquinone] iron-sulfur protein 5-like [Trichoplusia ni]